MRTNKTKSILVAILGFIVSRLIYTVVYFAVVLLLIVVSKIPFASHILNKFIEQGTVVEIAVPFLAFVAAFSVVSSIYNAIFSSDSAETQSLAYVISGVLVIVAESLFLVTNIICWTDFLPLISNIAMIFLGVSFIKEA